MPWYFSKMRYKILKYLQKWFEVEYAAPVSLLNASLHKVKLSREGRYDGSPGDLNISEDFQGKLTIQWSGNTFSKPKKNFMYIY